LGRRIQIAIVTLGIVATVLIAWSILQTPTMILPSWLLVLMIVPIICLIALLVGFLIKVILKSEWHSITFASLLITIIYLAIYSKMFRPSYRIELPDQYAGKVLLLVSNEKENDFKINKYGIGYINQYTFKNGFRPYVFKAGKNISDLISGYSTGSFSTNMGFKLSFNFLSFDVPGNTNNSSPIPYDSLVKLKAIDTTRVKRR
jgi:energy-coupling factor transporter transmembrane protein EcfT